MNHLTGTEGDPLPPIRSTSPSALSSRGSTAPTHPRHQFSFYTSRSDRSRSQASATSTLQSSSSCRSALQWLEGEQKEVGSNYDYCQPDSISGWIKCAICLGPFFDPVTSSNCSHTFCRRCIIQHTIASHGKSLDAGDDHVPPSTTKRDDWILACPACRSPGRLSSFKPSPPLVRNLVDSLTVLCPMFGRGCQWSGERAYVDYHLRKDCGYVWIGEIEPSDANNTRDVPSDDKEGGDSVDPASPSEPSTSHRKSKPRCECGAKIYRKDWYLHQAKGCSARWKTCHWCHELIKEEEDEREEEGHALECRTASVECMHCQETINRDQLRGHLDKDCPELPVQCSMAPFGCHWKGSRILLGHGTSATGLNTESNSNAGDAGGSQPHSARCAFLPLKTYLIATQARIQTLEEENVSLRREAESHRQALQSSKRQVDKCIQVLGKWAQTPYANLRGDASVDTAELDSDMGRSSEVRPLTGDIGWPEAVRADGALHAQPSPSAAATGNSVLMDSNAGSLAEVADAHSGPSGLERTLLNLSSSIAALNIKHRDLIQMVCDSRREGVMESIEMGRLAEEICNLKMGLHTVARLQMRGSAVAAGNCAYPAEMRSPTAPSAAGGKDQKISTEASTSDKAGIGSDLMSPGEHPSALIGNEITGILHAGTFAQPAALHHHYYHYPSSSALLSEFGASPFLGPSHTGYQPYLGPTVGTHLSRQPFHPRHFPLSPPPPPGPRRFWSGLEQTKL